MRLSLNVFIGHVSVLGFLLLLAWLLAVPGAVVLVLAGTGLLAATVSSRLVARRVHRPLRELTMGAQQVAAGDFNPIALRDTPEDFVRLTEAFNQMVVSLRSRDQQLQELNDQLTRRLRELNALYEVSRSVNSSLNGQEVLHTILQETVKTFPTARKGLIHLIDGTGTQLIPVALSTTERQVNRSMGMPLNQGIAARVVRERRPITVPDTAQHPDFLDLGSNVRSLMVTPLEIGDTVIGALSLDSDRRNAFTPDMEAVFGSLANRAAIAIENARLYGESQRRVEELTNLYGVALELSEEQSPDSLHEKIVACAVRLLDATGGALFLADPAQRSLCPTVILDVADEAIASRPAFGETLVGEVAAAREPRTRNLSPGMLRQRPSAHHTVAAPLIWESRVLGVIQLFREAGADHFEASDARLLTLLAQQAASAMENARLLVNQRRRSRQLALLNNINRRFAAILDEGTLVEEAVAGVEEAFGYSVVSIGLIEQRWLVIRGTSATIREQLSGTWMPIGASSIMGHVAETGQPYLANDVASDPYYTEILPDVQSELAVPIIGKEGVLGVLGLQERRRDAFHYTDVTLLQSLAVQLGIALDNARLFDAAQRRAEQVTKILDVTEEVRQQQALDRVLQVLADAVQQTLGWRTVALVLHDAADDTPLVVASDHPEVCAETLSLPAQAQLPALWQDARYRVSQSYFIRAEAAPAAVAPAEPLVQTARSGEPKPWEWHEDDLLVIPIVGHSGLLGHLSVDSPRSNRRPKLEEIQMLELFAHQAASAIEDTRLIEELQAKTHALESVNEDLSRASRLKSEFLANMSHELRTPLNSVLGFSEILIDETFGTLTDRQAKYVRNIHTSGQHLLDLINDVLDLSKIEAGRMELVVEPFSVDGAVQEVYAIVEPLASKKQLHVSIDTRRAPQRLIADRLRVKQMLYNLISNAVKFTPDGGCVEIHVWQRAVRGNNRDHLVYVEVADTGVGIPADEMGHIFDVFHRLDRPYRRDTEGTGLGLALVRRFAELHGGEVRVKSTVGKGSTFTLVLPQTQDMTLALASQLEQGAARSTSA